VVAESSTSASDSTTSATALTMSSPRTFHDLHALRPAPVLGDPAHAGALDHSPLRDEHEVLVPDDERRGEAAAGLGDVIVFTPFAPREVLRYSPIGVRLP
jgi:hypothetical protein